MANRVKQAHPVAQPPSAVPDASQGESSVAQPVAPPPSAVPASAAISVLPKPKAKPFLAETRRKLPHLQAEDKTYVVTFCSKSRWVLPESVRGKILEHCRHDHGMKFFLHAAVVMPDHVHLLLTPMRDEDGNPYGLSEIMSGIKGTSAHSINKLLGRRGSVWQDESFDHILRSDENLEAQGEYFCQNPVRKGLVSRPEDYPWLWLSRGDLVESEPGQPGAAVPQGLGSGQPGAAVPQAGPQGLG
jgi:REP element-mobilizing transposase RayT